MSSPAVPERVRRSLTVESGLNDGLAVPFLALFVVLAVEERSPSAHDWVGYGLALIGLGLLVGAVVGAGGTRLAQRASDAGFTTPGPYSLAPVAIAVLSWALADAIGGNGFIAAFTAGLVAGHLRATADDRRALDVSEDEGLLLSLVVFFIFGTVAIGHLANADLAIVGYAVLSLTVLRMLPVAVALRGTGLRPSTVAFMGWFGPRGLASIILALTVVEAQPGLAGLDAVMAAMTVTVLASIVAHGLSAQALTRGYVAGLDDLPADAPEHDDRGAIREEPLDARLARP